MTFHVYVSNIKNRTVGSLVLLCWECVAYLLEILYCGAVRFDAIYILIDRPNHAVESLFPFTIHVV